MNKSFFTMGFCALFACYGANSLAADYDVFEDQPLSFGKFAIVDNLGPKTIVVMPDNNVIYDTGLVPNTQAQRGEYRFERLPPNVTFYLGVNVPNPPAEGGLMVDNATNVTTGGGQVFTLSDFKVNATDELISDASGDAIMYLGATLTTSGNSLTYGDGMYTGQYQITIYY